MLFRAIIVMVVILSLLLQTACRTSHGVNNNVDEGSTGQVVTLRYASYLLDTAQASKVYYDAIEEFEAIHPNIKIEPDFIQNASYMAGIKIRLLGGVPLDVFDTWSPSLFQEFRKLNPNIYLDLTGSTFLNDFVPNVLQPVTVNGKAYGVPEVMHSDGLLYNKRIFARLGLSVPQTWSEFINVCEQLKQAGIIPVAMDSYWSTAQFFWGSIMTSNGADGEWTKKLENGQISVRNSIFVDAISKQKEIINRGFVPSNWSSMKHEQSKDLFGQEKAAMMITGTWDIPSVLERDKNLGIGFMMVPGENKAVPNINIGTYRVISAKTKHPEEAKAFVAFMSSKVTQEKLAEGARAVPSIAGAKVDNPISKEIATYVTRPDAILYWPHTVSTESLQVKIQEGVNHYLAGQSLEKTLEEIQIAIDSAHR